MKSTWFVLLGLVFLTPVAGCTRNAVTGDLELIWISTRREIEMGREAAPEMVEALGGRFYEPALADYVEEVGGRVASMSDRPMPYTFTLVRSTTPNAFALPGGQIFITAGLAVHLRNERQLAAVLAHEVTHVAARHNVKALQRRTGRSILLNVAGWFIGGFETLAAEVVTGMVNLHYSRGNEYEADHYGIRYLTRAGYNPWGMVELLTVLQEVSRSRPSLFTEMFATHPVTDKRVEEAEETILEDPVYQGYARSAPDPAAQRYEAFRQRLLQVMPELAPAGTTQPAHIDGD